MNLWVPFQKFKELIKKRSTPGIEPRKSLKIDFRANALTTTPTGHCQKKCNRMKTFVLGCISILVFHGKIFTFLKKFKFSMWHSYSGPKAVLENGILWLSYSEFVFYCLGPNLGRPFLGQIGPDLTFLDNILILFSKIYTQGLKLCSKKVLVGSLPFYIWF